jgi:5-methylthioadenosine/S-adenosylhomocysteine deaminase
MGTILIENGGVLGPAGWLEPGFVSVVHQEIHTVAAGSPPEALKSQADTVLDARHCAVLPGLVNAHTHLSQTFMRGLVGGRPLIEWLRELIWPIQEVIAPEELRLAALLGLVENLHCGAIHVVNNHKVVASPIHTDAVLDAAQEIGLRFTLARAWSDRGAISESPAEILQDFRRLYEKWSDPSGLIQIANGPIALWRCSQETLQNTHALALEHGSFTHCHVSETREELRMCLDETGLRPVHWLADIGVLDPYTQVVHAVWIDAEEIERLAEVRSPVIHCPVSNGVLGSGIAPVPKMLAAGVDLRLGTDGPASNDTQDLWETVKLAVNFARGSAQDPTVLPPDQALSIATGGRVLEPGAPADLIVVDLNHPRAVPVHDLSSALVLGTHGSDVRDALVNGEFLLRAGQVQVLDEAALYDACREAVKNLRKKAGLWD